MPTTSEHVASVRASYGREARRYERPRSYERESYERTARPYEAFRRQSYERAHPPIPPHTRAAIQAAARMGAHMEARSYDGSFPAESAAEARGNSREPKQTFFRLSGFGDGPGRVPLARGPTDAAGAYPPYDLAAPLAPGGDTGRLGPRGAARSRDKRE